jgi:NitT/TauT family transport system ATP-binding protein
VNANQSKLVVEDLRLGHRSRLNGKFTTACEDLSFDVQEGEFVAIVGPSGCGKTTFLTAVAGLMPVASGRLELDGRQLRGPGRDRSLVFQHASLFPWRNVTGNVSFPLQAQKRNDEKGKERVRQLLELVGLGDNGNTYPRELSGGMMQRVNLARALVTDPELLLLDEPFAALDAQTREVMQSELTRIWQADEVSSGKTAVFITHDVPEAVFLADRVIVFSRGPAHLVESVPVDLGRPRTREVKRTPEFLAITDHILDLVMQQSDHGMRSASHGHSATVDA